MASWRWHRVKLHAIELVKRYRRLEDAGAGFHENVAVRQDRRGSVRHVVAVGEVRTGNPSSLLSNLGGRRVDGGVPRARGLRASGKYGAVGTQNHRPDLEGTGI